MVTVCPSQFATRRTLFHVLVGCGLLMLKVSRLKLPVIWLLVSMWLFFFNDTATTEIYTLSLHDALPIYLPHRQACRGRRQIQADVAVGHDPDELGPVSDQKVADPLLEHQWAGLEHRHRRRCGDARNGHQVLNFHHGSPLRWRRVAKHSTSSAMLQGS